MNEAIESIERRLEHEEEEIEDLHRFLRRKQQRHSFVKHVLWGQSDRSCQCRDAVTCIPFKITGVCHSTSHKLEVLNKEINRLHSKLACLIANNDETQNTRERLLLMRKMTGAHTLPRDIIQYIMTFF